VLTSGFLPPDRTLYKIKYLNIIIKYLNIIIKDLDQYYWAANSSNSGRQLGAQRIS